MAATGTLPDLITSEGVEQYLSQTPFAASHVTLLAGGLSNFTYRIRLKEAYAYVVGSNTPCPIRTMVLKHAEPYVAANKNYAWCAGRQDYEAMAFNHVPELTAPSPVVSLPKIYHEDREQHVLLITDCGETSTTLKSLLQTAPPDVDTSQTIGQSLGTFLARLHTASITSKDTSATASVSRGEKLKAAFGSNTPARSISAFVTYGRIVSTLTSDQSIITPPLDLSPAQLAAITDVSKTMQARIASCDDVLTMGDFWPGNLIVSLDRDWSADIGVHVDVVDWELAKPGMAGLDIGQFFAEMLQMRTFYLSSRASVDTIVLAFSAAYREVVMERGGELDMGDVARVAATHVGAHLIALTPRSGWGAMEVTREVVRLGVEYILRVMDGDEAWLSESVVGGLMGSGT